MHRSWIPVFLASLGFAMIILSMSMPLFEWQINEIVADFPSTYEVHSQPSPWITRLGDSLDRGSYVSFGQIYVSRGDKDCRHENLNFVVKRSHNAEMLERLSLNVEEGIIPWLIKLSVVDICLSIGYLWWFTIWYKRPIWKAMVFTSTIGAFYIGFTQIVRNLLPRVAHLGNLDCYSGTVMFSAVLSKVHYEMLVVLVVGILLGLGAFGMLLHQIVVVVLKKKKGV